MSSQTGPPVESFPARELPERINTLPNGKARKPPVKLEDCELMQLTQYKCDIQETSTGAKPHVVCRPFMRLFRSCQGGLMVETTEWEWIHAAETELAAGKSADSTSK